MAIKGVNIFFKYSKIKRGYYRK